MKTVFGNFQPLVVVLALLSSCNSQDKKSGETISSVKEDSVVRDIPMNKNGKPPNYYKNKSDVELKMGLNTLEKGFDSIQIRLWYGYGDSFDGNSQLAIIKCTTGKWASEMINFKYHYNIKDDSIISITKQGLFKEPKSGWGTLVRQLSNLGLMTLPDDGKIPGYHTAADGDAVIVEIATKNVYRIYSYQEPHLNKDHIEEANRMEQILELIETEFDFQRLRKL